MKSVPVCIIGGGPVGMSLALNLDALGVKSVIVNREPNVLVQPRGSTQNSRTMEHYRRLGLSAAIRKLGLPHEHATDVVYFTRLDGFEIARLSMPSEAEKLLAIASAAEAIGNALDELRELDRDTVRRQRREKFLAIGRTLG